MSKQISVDSEVLKKAADYAAQAGPKLEKLASDERVLSELIPAWADRMVEQGLLKKEAKAEFIAEVDRGGISKVGDLFELLISNVGPQSMGQPAEKRASVSTGKSVRQSDAAWEASLGF